MVHNGIEYADMQLIAEAYDLMRSLLGLSPPQLALVFARWDRGDLDSYLMEITSDILRQRDPHDRRRAFVDIVLDAAGQKGTGGWTVAWAAEGGVPASTIAEAVFARAVSALRDERLVAAKKLAGPRARRPGAKEKWIAAVREALYASKICAYAQGFAMLSQAREAHGWQLDLARIARIWRGGCIIRARFLQKIASAYEREPQLGNLLVDRFFRRKLREAQSAWREVVALAARSGVACPAFMSALGYYDSYRAARLPANLLQAQRDYFGAHGYERVDRPRGQLFHLEWEQPGRPETP
jgi:6-phosphogluconate dehydrogenase